MGQAASKAAEAASKAAKRSSAASSVHRISQPVQAQQRTRTAPEPEWKRSSHPNPPVGEYSPTRGHGHDRLEADTAARIAAAASAENDTVPELPPDLIKFLNDAGPVERTVDKERTSSKVYDTLVKDEKARHEQAKQANKRVRRKMPLHASYGDSGNEDDGTMVERSTNFSTTDRSKTQSTRLGVTREDFFRLLSSTNDDDNTNKVNKGMKIKMAVDSPDWKKMMEAEYEGIVAKQQNSASNSQSSFDQLKDKTLFENSLRYIGVPTLMKDTDGDIVGVWPQKAKDLQHSHGIKVVPKRSLDFVMMNEGGGGAAAAKEKS